MQAWKVQTCANDGKPGRKRTDPQEKRRRTQRFRWSTEHKRKIDQQRTLYALPKERIWKKWDMKDT